MPRRWSRPGRSRRVHVDHHRRARAVRCASWCGPGTAGTPGGTSGSTKLDGERVARQVARGSTMNGAKLGCTGKRFHRLSRSEVNSSSVPRPTRRSPSASAPPANRASTFQPASSSTRRYRSNRHAARATTRGRPGGAAWDAGCRPPRWPPVARGHDRFRRQPHARPRTSRRVGRSTSGPSARKHPSAVAQVRGQRARAGPVERAGAERRRCAAGPAPAAALKRRPSITATRGIARRRPPRARAGRKAGARRLRRIGRERRGWGAALGSSRR